MKAFKNEGEVVSVRVKDSGIYLILKQAAAKQDMTLSAYLAFAGLVVNGLEKFPTLTYAAVKEMALADVKVYKKREHE